MSIYLQEGIDNSFFRVLSALYSPLLSAYHLKDRFQFTIYSSKYPFPLGIISINRGKNSFLQLAVIPESRGRGVAQQAIDEIIRITETRRVDWGCKKFNYPSLKILHTRKGGIFEKSSESHRGASHEGFFRVDKEVSMKMRDALAQVLPSSKEEYQRWHATSYVLRHKERLALRKYLFTHIKAIDSHLHVHPMQLPTSLTGEGWPQHNKFVRYISPQELLTAMHRNAIAKTIIFGVPSHDAGVSHQVNRFILEYANSDSGRFIPFAILVDDMNVPEAIRSGFRGFKEHVYAQKLLRGRNGTFTLSSSKRKLLYAEIAKAGVPLISHMGPNVVPRVADILRKVPTLKLVIAHLGASCDGPVSWSEVQDKLKKLSQYPNVYFDISAISDISVIEQAASCFGDKNILWGSDWPWGSMVEPPVKAIDSVIASEALDIFSIYNIFRRNAEKLLQ